MVSFIPQRVCNHALSTVHVVKLDEVTLGQKPITTKKWVTDLYTGSLPCTCDQYPILSFILTSDMDTSSYPYGNILDLVAVQFKAWHLCNQCWQLLASWALYI